MRIIHALSVSATLLGLAVSAHASTVTYGSQASFSSAVTGLTIYTIPTIAAPGGFVPVASPYTVGPLSFSASALYNENDSAYGAGVSYLDNYTSANYTITGGSFTALAFNIGTYDGAETVAVNVNGLPVATLNTPAGRLPLFFGVTSTVPISSVVLTDTSEAVGTGEVDITGFETATARTSVAITPEPSSLVLLGTGIVGMAGAARRRFVVA